MASSKVNNKEIVLRQWFAARYGNVFENHAEWRLPQGIAEMSREYAKANHNMPVSFNFFMYKVREIEIEVRTTGTFKLYEEVIRTSHLDAEGVRFEPTDDVSDTGTVTTKAVVAAPVEVELNIERLDDMEFPSFRDFPTNTIFDEICSDDDELRGATSGMVIVCTGESGVGKSTLLLHVIAKMKETAKARHEAGEIDKPVDALYISGEMTRTDLFFYKKKMPGIGKVNTMIIADYMKKGLREAVEKAFHSEEYDIILLDSYQDLVEKMQDVLDWRAKEAENFLIQLMIDAAEKRGKCIMAIQHLTKGGEYVGRTFLKHATTAMMQLKFDKDGSRYVMFSKNRRCGSGTHIPIYFDMVKGTGEIVFDVDKYRTTINAGDLAKSARERSKELVDNFDTMFGLRASAVGNDGGEDEHDEDEFTDVDNATYEPIQE